MTNGSQPALEGVARKEAPLKDEHIKPAHQTAERSRRESTAGRFRLLIWFLLLSLLSVTAVSLASAALLSRYVTESLLNLDGRLTTEFINHLFAFEGADTAFTASPERPVPPALAKFFAQVGQMPDILRANIYLLDGTVYWSTDPSIVGRQFTGNDELAEAVEGEPQAEVARITDDDKDEHVGLASPGTQFVENYMPMYRNGDSRQPVVAVAEVYRTPKDLFDRISTGQRLVYLGAAAGALLIIAALGSLVAYADRMIRRQAQAIADGERLATAGEMAAAVAHGLRNPLAVIRSSAELALRLRSAERTVPLLEDIVLQADRLEHWVRQYLTAAEPGSADRCDEVKAVVEAVRANLADQLERQRIDWDDQRLPKLPPVAIGGALLEQILTSIATNAMQAMPEGGAIRITGSAGGGTMTLIVADNGRGMDENQLRRAFEPFVTSKQSGLGLGLALTRRILARHHGRIAIESKLGHGTSVSLTLPIAS
jgi:two-component system sensor histidine kinase HydH